MPSWLARPCIVSLKCFAILVPVLLLGLGLIYLRLLHSPISVSFVVAPVERGLNAELLGFSVDIGDAIVRLSERGGLEFRLTDIRITDEDGDVVGRASLAGVGLSAKALLSGRIAPSRVDLIEPRILVSRNEDGRLSLSFTPEGSATRPAPAAGKVSSAPSKEPSASSSNDQSVRRIDLARMFAEAAGRARRQEGAASFLQEIGFKDAYVVYDSHSQRSTWQVPEFHIRVDHKQKRSVISGEGAVATPAGPWTFGFRTEDSQKAQAVRLDVTIKDLIPGSLTQGAHFAMLKGLDFPVSGNGGIEFSRDGEIQHSHFSLDLESGRLSPPWLDKPLFTLGASRFDVRYDGDKQKFDLGPSRLSWGGSHAVIAGTIVNGATLDRPVQGWVFDLRTVSGLLAAEDLKVPPLQIDKWVIRGRIGPDPGYCRMEEFNLQAGAAQVTMNGTVSSTASGIDASLDGQISPMPVQTLKALWPNSLAPRTREWMGANITRGTLKSGSFRLATHRDAAAGAGSAGNPQDRRLSLTLEGADVDITYMKGMPPIEAPRALLRVEGSDVEVTIPEASIAAAQGRRVGLKTGRLFATNIDTEHPLAEISLRAQSPLQAVLDLVEQNPSALAGDIGTRLAGFDGKVDGQMRMTLPLGGEITANDMKLEGKARVTEGRAKNIIGPHDISGATLNFDLTEKSMDVRGDMLLGGVNIKVGWQRLVGVPDAQQPPVKLTAKLDNSDRAQLDLDLNHMVQGEVPVEVTVQRREQQDAPHVHFVADLTGAELILDDIAWRKPAGRPASLEFDAVKGNANQVELQNFKLIGDNVAIDGAVVLGSDHHPKEFSFPQFSVNVVTNLQVHGTMRPGRVWDVKAQGKTFDGKDLFNTLISFGQLSDRPHLSARERPGLDLVAEVDTVLGASDTTIRSIKLKLQKRSERMTMLDLRGTLDGGKVLAARLRPDPGRARLLVADTADAGQALKLVGFYSNMIGGTADLEVNLDAKGAAERSGVLAIRNFRVLGDPIISEVLQTQDDGRPAIDNGRRGRRVVREQFEFERLRAPFSMGNGQFVLDNAQVTGPMVGATMRGKIDYKSQRLQLGGTYIPLSGVNRSFAPIPILGPLLTGPRGEGVLGITFAIEGPMAEPQVIVNPLSMVMPGIFREIFQMTPENPSITPRNERAQPKTGKTGKGSPQVRASPPSDSSFSDSEPRVHPEVLGGWSAETTAPKSKQK
jgi:hypothetical protein